MRSKKLRLAACALLSLLFVFGGVSVLRHADKRLPLNPIAAAETITAAENTREETTAAVTQRETAADTQDGRMQRRRVDTGIPHTGRNAPVTAFARGSAAGIGTESPDGAPQLRPDGKRIGTGFEGDAGNVSVPASSAPVFIAETTTAAPETTTVPAATTVPETTTAPVKTASPSYRSPTTLPSTEPTTVLPEPTTVREESTTEEKREPVIDTDLKDEIILQSNLAAGELRFYAVLDGDTDGYSLHVRWTRPDGTTEKMKPEGINYHAPLPLGANCFTLTIFQGGKAVSAREFTVVVAADKATDEDHPVGEHPPVITTNLDDGTKEFTSSHLALNVTAQTYKGTPIYADHLTVLLDGVEVRNPTGRDRPEYELFFTVPNNGNIADHSVTVLAWDNDGNSAVRKYEIVYRHVSDGDELGKVTVILDATTVGLGVLDRDTVDMRQGDSVAAIVRRMLDKYEYTYDFGNESAGAYLRWIGGNDMCDRAKVPDNLWTMILRDGLTTTAPPDRDRLSELDYTQGSGWMFCINDRIFPGKGMERTYLNPGDTLRVCFTLSFGKDVGGFNADGAGMGSLAGYCGLWRDGRYTPLAHTWGAPGTDGTVTCTVCHEKHTHIWSQPDEHGNVICTTCHEQRKESGV